MFRCVRDCLLCFILRAKQNVNMCKGCIEFFTIWHWDFFNFSEFTEEVLYFIFLDISFDVIYGYITFRIDIFLSVNLLFFTLDVRKHSLRVLLHYFATLLVFWIGHFFNDFIWNILAYTCKDSKLFEISMDVAGGYCRLFQTSFTFKNITIIMDFILNHLFNSFDIHVLIDILDKNFLVFLNTLFDRFILKNI